MTSSQTKTNYFERRDEQRTPVPKKSTAPLVAQPHSDSVVSGPPPRPSRQLISSLKDHQRSSLLNTHNAFPHSHLCGPELHQYSLPLRVLVSPLLLQEPPVSVKPRARPGVLGQTCWSQQPPQSSAEPCGLSSSPLSHTDKHHKVRERPTGKTWVSKRYL